MICHVIYFIYIQTYILLVKYWIYLKQLEKELNAKLNVI